MNSTAKRILTALWVAGAFAGLLAIIVLPGRWDRGGLALAHTSAGVEIIDTAALVTSHSLDTTGNADADPGTALLIDTDGDTVVDSIAVAAGTTVKVVVHSRTAAGTANSPDGTDVTFTATGSAVFQAVGLDAGANGALDATGDLTAITDTQTVIAQVVRDIDAGNAGEACDAAADTCIDGAGDGDADGTPLGTDDGIAIVEVRSGIPTSSTVTATTAVGSDSVGIIWTGAVTKIDVTATVDNAADPNKLLAQTIISQAGVLGGVFKGDPDLTITATARDSAQNPVSGAQVDCALDTAGGGRADLIGDESQNDEATDNAADPGGNSVFAETTNAAGQVQMSLEAEDQAGNSRGDVTVTCWEDGSGTVANVLDGTEPNASVTVRVSGPPATVDLTGDATMGVGSQTLTATVTDADGEAVADATNCTWLLIDPLTIAGLTSPTSGNAEGTTANVSTNVLIAAAAGAVTVSVTCGTANDLLSITVSGVAPPVFPPGDVNCDGDFTVTDLLAAARALVGLDPALTAC